MKSKKPLYARVWFWLFSVVALYAFLGFIVLPLTLVDFAPKKIKENAGIDFGVEKVYFNPFNFKITLFHPYVKDKHNKEVISFESLHVELNPSALIKKEILLRKLELNKPKILIKLLKDGSINLNTLIPKNTKEEAKKEKKPLDLIFTIKDLDIKNGEILFKDESIDKSFSLELKPLNYHANDISTKNGKLAAHKFEASSSYAKKLAWEGGLSLDPLKFYGKIMIEDLKLTAVNNYSNISVERGLASVFLPYKINVNKEGLKLDIENARLVLNDFLIMNDNAKLAHIGQFKFFDIKFNANIKENNIDINLPKSTLFASHIIAFENNKQMANLDFFGIENLSSKIILKDGKPKGNVELTNIKTSNIKANKPSNIAINANLEKIDISKVKTKISSFLDIKVSIPNFNVNKLGISHLDNSPLAGFSMFNIKDIFLDLEKQNINISKTSLLGLYTNIIMKNDGSLDISSLIPKTQKNENLKKENSKPWTYTLKDINIKKAKASFSDLSIKKPITHKLSSIDLHVKDFNSNFKTPFEYKLNLKDKNTFGFKTQGNIILEPLHVQSFLDIKHTSLSMYQQYITPFTTLYLKNAQLLTKAEVEIKIQKDKPININAKANTKINNLLLTNNDKTIFSWKELNLEGISYKHTPLSLHVKGISIDEPYARIKINEDRTTNLDNIIKSSNNEEISKAEKKNDKKLDIKIGPMILKKGSADFADFSLPLKFATKIHDLDGFVSKLNLNSTQPSKMSLKGLVDKYGYANIEGSLSPFALKKHADIGVTFKNIDLTNMTPYSGKFVGYAIKTGKLSLDLNYNIRDAALQGDNKINLDSLSLGKKIQSKEALNLPLDLALALLKDSQGQIDIDLPVTGDLNNPKFSYGAVVVKAITNLITGIITAPFKLLGSLLGIDGEKLKTIDFEPAFASLLPSEMQKMQNYSKMLAKRPGIKLKIFGTYDKEIDTKKMKKLTLNASIEKEINLLDKNVSEEKHYQIALEKVYFSHFNKEDFNTTLLKYITYEKKESNTSKKLKPPKIDYANLNDDLRKQLFKKIDISKEKLEKLAENRAENIKIELIKVGIKEERIKMEKPKEGKAKQNKWIGCEVKISS